MKTLVAAIMAVFLFAPAAQAGDLSDLLRTFGSMNRNCSDFDNCLRQQEKYERRYYDDYKRYKEKVEEVEELEAKIRSLEDEVARIQLRANGSPSKSQQSEIDRLRYQIQRTEDKLVRPLDDIEDLADTLADHEEEYISVGGRKNYLNKWALKKFNERQRSRRRIR